MKILGISNPAFLGVTIATQAISTHHLGVAPISLPSQAEGVVESIVKHHPDLLIVGGWSPGYFEILQRLKALRTFPVLSIYHSTLFHGSAVVDDQNWPQFEMAYQKGYSDLMGFVQPQTAEYYQKVRGLFAVFVPHAFKSLTPPQTPRGFRIGILGGINSWYKNVTGAFTVAKDFCARNKDAEIVAPGAYNKPHEAHLATIGSCAVLIHPSHLECYSNTILEAWARGVPVIYSPNCDGIARNNPLLDTEEKAMLEGLRLNSAIEAMQLYRLLDSVRRNREFYSKQVYGVYQSLFKKTQLYNRALFSRIITDYPNREHDVGFFESPFTLEGIPWKEISGT